MFDLIIKSFYFALPAYLANMAPVIFDKLKLLKFLNRPIDGGRKWGQSDYIYIFGPTKTWRGLVAAVIMGLVATTLQTWLYNFEFFHNLSIINYPDNFILFGLLAGLGAILGDLLKSFLKRRLKMTSGRPWPVFDQLDFVAGFLLFTYFIIQPPIAIIITIFLITLVLHPLTNIISYLIGFKKVWW